MHQLQQFVREDGIEMATMIILAWNIRQISLTALMLDILFQLRIHTSSKISIHGKVYFPRDFCFSKWRDCERAKSIYFKDWDTKPHSYPNNSNIERLRDFIRHVYVDRRFGGDRSSEKPPRGEDSYENRSDESRSGSQSPPYEDTYDHRRNDRPSPGGRSDNSYSKYDDRSPENNREVRYSSDQGKTLNRPKIVTGVGRADFSMQVKWMITGLLMGILCQIAGHQIIRRI